MEKATYLVIGSKPWNRRIFEEVIIKYPGTWHFFSLPDELRFDIISSLVPRYIFFLHWSWKVPPEIINNFKCVCFHMSDVPYGRGGSPLQNLILNGHRHTKLTALRMVEEFDAGPVFGKKDLCLEGSAEEIYIRSSQLAAQMIYTIIAKQPVPEPQVGEPVIFKRRQPDESAIPESASLQSLHDFIRMLDAEGYPRAFLEHKGFRFQFDRATLYEGKIIANVTITPTRMKKS